MAVSTIPASAIMDRVARLLNDSAKTDYTYTVQIPFLNMAIEEYSDIMSEANTSFARLTNVNWQGSITVPIGYAYLAPPEHPDPDVPKYPDGLVEIQEINERPAGSNDVFRLIPRREFQEYGFPATNSLLYWVWERGIIRFNPPGATIPIELVIKYLLQGIGLVTTENDNVSSIGARTYLSYKTAALCAMFIGENPERAGILEAKAEESIERNINISNKGSQQIMTRHRPFRANWKMRGGF